MICTTENCHEHYGCRLRAKGLQVSPRVHAGRTPNWTPTPDRPPAHYRNILTEDRPGGFKSPILRPDGAVIRHKEGNEQAHKISDQLQRTRAAIAQPH